MGSRIDGCGVNDDITVVLAGVVGQVLVATADFVAPFADSGDFAARAEHAHEGRFVAAVGEPDRVVEVVDDLFAEDVSDEPLEDRRADGHCLAVEEDEVVRAQSKQK